MSAEYNLTLQATLLSETEKKWLLTSVSSNDIPLAIVVDEAMKKSILLIQRLFKCYPRAFLKCLSEHYGAIIAGVHDLAAEAEGKEVSEWAAFPIFGITGYKAYTEGTAERYKIEYVISGNASRYIKGDVDSKLYEAIRYISEDYAKHPQLWYYALTNCLALFKAHIKTEGEANA